MDQTLHDHKKKKNNNYAFLNEFDITRRIDDRIAIVSSVLSISKPDASILLRHYGWNPNHVHEAWFHDETRIRNSTGLINKTLESRTMNKTLPETLTCGICFDVCESVPADAPLCGHVYCTECWTLYVSASIEDGPGCVFLRCPDPSCAIMVGFDMIEKLVSEKDYEKYRRFVVSSYVEGDSKTKWCPGLGCEYAIELEGDVFGSDNYDVSCRCSYGFCWNCTEESHRPVDCATVSNWIAKNVDENKNVTWISAFTKPCPKCNRPIEKSTGCNHMTCRAPCRAQFCWLCLRDPKDHVCNRYEEVDEDKVKRKLAKKSLRRYAHYFERWLTNSKSEKKAFLDLREVEGVMIEELSRTQLLPITLLRFVTDAWVLIVECRRILKWTYAFGFYLLEEEPNKKAFFECLQGEAEAALERLHNCAETKLLGYINVKGPSETFNDFRVTLMGLTTGTRNYFENLVKALENGLSDVDSTKTEKAQKKRIREYGQVINVSSRRRQDQNRPW